MKAPGTYTLILCVLTAMLPLAGKASASTDSVLSAALEHYSAGDYDEALALWQGLLEDGHKAADLHYNAGNAYFKLGELHQAILHWEKCVKLDPRHKDARYNLRLANTMIDDKIEAVPELFLSRWYFSVVNAMSTGQWRWLALGLAILAAGFVGMTILRGWRAAMAIGLVLLILSLASIALSVQSSINASRISDAIIFTPTITIKSSPNDQGQSLFVLHQGTKVHLLDELQDWYRIRIADGNEGWLRKSDVEVI